MSGSPIFTVNRSTATSSREMASAEGFDNDWCGILVCPVPVGRTGEALRECRLAIALGGIELSLG